LYAYYTYTIPDDTHRIQYNNTIIEQNLSGSHVT